MAQICISMSEGLSIEWITAVLLFIREWTRIGWATCFLQMCGSALLTAGYVWYELGENNPLRLMFTQLYIFNPYSEYLQL